jgi:chromosome segregation ATPase
VASDFSADEGDDEEVAALRKEISTLPTEIASLRTTNSALEKANSALEGSVRELQDWKTTAVTKYKELATVHAKLQAVTSGPSATWTQVRRAKADLERALADASAARAEADVQVGLIADLRHHVDAQALQMQ